MSTEQMVPASRAHVPDKAFADRWASPECPSEARVCITSTGREEAGEGAKEDQRQMNGTPLSVPWPRDQIAYQRQQEEKKFEKELRRIEGAGGKGEGARTRWCLHRIKRIS